MLTINQVAKKFGLSRSTLLYYDKIGLLSPITRSGANYRLYSAHDVEKMTKISAFREAGLTLDEIKPLVEDSEGDTSQVLAARLENINNEMNRLRQQQQFIVKLLGKGSLLGQIKTVNKVQWVNILRASGMTDEDMHRWHIAFENDLPAMHEDFLYSLGCEKEEVESIRRWSHRCRE